MKKATLLILAGLPLMAQPKINYDLSPLRKLIVSCKSDDLIRSMMCAAYIHGFMEGWDETRRIHIVEGIKNKDTQLVTEMSIKERDRTGICIVSDWTVGYVMAVIGQYGIEHPEQLNEPTQRVMFDILKRAFPCGKGAK